ncbi:hypothetical protein EDB80DRAFT_573058 [Ilyonectria destructans]|nr:hypothetical protein EDB80DRAFT_573058 [Ilyonectria destructans]
MLPRIDSPRQLENLRNYKKLTAVRDYFKQARAATLDWTDWSEPDDWKKQFGPGAKISGPAENIPFLDWLKENEVDVLSEIRAFVSSYPTSRRKERRADDIEGFCRGAKFVLDDSVPGDHSHSQLTDAQEPTAWVSDRNWVPGSETAPRRYYERVLNNTELCEVLQKKRFHENSFGPPRRIYINNPNGATILALIRTAPASQAEGFRELFANYITDILTPNFTLRASSWWAGCFVISFNLPFYAISTKEKQDLRMGFYGKNMFRRRHSVSFLNLESLESKTPSEEDDNTERQTFLYQGVSSIMLTGKNDQYWTAVCLDEDFSGEEARLTSDDETLDELGTPTDPILAKADCDATKSPREYAFAALATSLLRIVEHHGDVQDCYSKSLMHHTSGLRDGSIDNISPEDFQGWGKRFQETLGMVIHCNSRVVDKLNMFLQRGVMISLDGLPHSSLLRGLQRDQGFVESLRDIVQARDDLQDIGSELSELLKNCEKSCEDSRRERKDDHADEQQSIARQVQQFTSAALVLGVQNLVAQLYSGRPENGGSSSWPGFIAVVLLIMAITVLASVALFREQMSRCSARLSSRIARTQIAQGCLCFLRKFFHSIGACFGLLRDRLVLLWNYLGIMRLLQLAARLLRR